MPNDKELSDFCCFIVLVFGVTALQLTGDRCTSAFVSFMISFSALMIHSLEIK